MDIDSDIDQTLLQQFSCMGTTDRDELVKQLQSLIGNLNETAAVFFLEMNNWNLQEAVCSYFDFETPYKLPSMTLVSDATVGEGESTIPPLTQFSRRWRIRNAGTEAWPEGCRVQFGGGHRLGAAERLAVEALPPGAALDVCVDMVSPERPGVYQSQWRLATASGCYFGDVMWAIVTVADGGTVDLAQQLQHLHTCDLAPPHLTATAHYTNPFASTLQDSAQQTQDGDSNMTC